MSARAEAMRPAIEATAHLSATADARPSSTAASSPGQAASAGRRRRSSAPPSGPLIARPVAGGFVFGRRQARLGPRGITLLDLINRRSKVTSPTSEIRGSLAIAWRGNWKWSAGAVRFFSGVSEGSP
jgi:hypothetical protein